MQNSKSKRNPSAGTLNRTFNASPIKFADDKISVSTPFDNFYTSNKTSYSSYFNIKNRCSSPTSSNTSRSLIPVPVKRGVLESRTSYSLGNNDLSYENQVLRKENEKLKKQLKELQNSYEILERKLNSLDKISIGTALSRQHSLVSITNNNYTNFEVLHKRLKKEIDDNYNLKRCLLKQSEKYMQFSKY